MVHDRNKSINKYQWKKRGLITNDFDSIYSLWKNSTNCEKCGHDYSYWIKCMDHCHKTGAFRYILCQKCNGIDKTNNTSGYPNVIFDKSSKWWKYCNISKGIIHHKFFKTKYEAIIYKWLYELGYSIET